MTAYRRESDLLGDVEVPADALHGPSTQRAVENFPLSCRRVHPELIRAYGAVKLACLRCSHGLDPWDADPLAAMTQACEEMMAGDLDHAIVVDTLQGGAGTSTNMNVNEVLANRTLQILGRPLGEYETISPHDDLNRHQSTNDTYPTAVRIAAIRLLRELESRITELVDAFQDRERALADVVKVGRTQLQDAVLTTLGRSMGAYADAFARDRWRIYNCEERLRVVNLGGSAIGTGLGAPRQFIFGAIEELRQITGLGLARAENMIDGTQNVDALVEVSGITKALATNIIKVSNDLRLLASGPDAGFGEITLPARQAGSSIMPGKVNPVIPEAAAQCGIEVCARDQVIAQAAAMGNLELSQFMPLIADHLLGSLSLLTNAVTMLARRCVRGIEARGDARGRPDDGAAVATALVPVLGYERVQSLVRDAADAGRTLRAHCIAESVLSAESFDALVSPEAVTRLGSPPPEQRP